MDIDAVTIAVVGIVFLSTFSRSAFGFGDGLIAMPLLALCIPITVAKPLIAIVSVLIAGSIVLRDWRSIHIKSAGWLIVSAMAGIPLGVKIITVVDERIVKSALGVFIIAFSTYQLIQTRRFVLTNDRPACLFGFIAGVLGGAYNTHGPPLIVYGALRRWSAERFRATLQGYYLPTGFLILFFDWQNGLWGESMRWYLLACVPAVLIAIPVGRKLNHYVRGKQIDRYLYGALIVIGATLLIKSLRPSNSEEVSPASATQVSHCRPINPLESRL